MKTLKTTLTACALASMFSLQAQSVPQFDESIFTNNQEVYLHKDTVIRVKSFAAHQAEGKTYLSWFVTGLKTEGSFIIYRSQDGENFEIIGVEQSSKTADNAHVGYFFTDNKPTQTGTLYYKIAHIGTNNSCFTSNKVSINSQSVNFANVNR
ncbi:MAG: hypothetical protein ACHQHP_06140 [Bacteroidia bacterium]